MEQRDRKPKRAEEDGGGILILLLLDLFLCAECFVLWGITVLFLLLDLDDSDSMATLWPICTVYILHMSVQECVYVNRPVVLSLPLIVSRFSAVRGQGQDT